MKYCMIACISGRNGIGLSGKIPWYNKKDLNFFKEKTFGDIVVMGRKTFDSLPNGPLKNRMNIVITSSPEAYKNSKNLIFTSIENINKLLDIYSEIYKKCWIIGGEHIYNHFIDKVSRLYITKINKTFECDTFFPVFRDKFIMSKTSEYIQSEDSLYTFRFEKYRSLANMRRVKLSEN